MLAGAFLIEILGRRVTHDIAFGALASMVALPFLAYVFGQPTELVYVSVGIALMLIVKRLTANWETPSTDPYGLPAVLLYRLLWDRDVPRRVEWTARRPPSEQED